MMKTLVTALALLTITFAGSAVAQVVYDNGPVNGNVDAWTINFGYEVSDSFTISGVNNVGALSFWAWLVPGDTITNVEVQLGTQPFANDLYDAFVNLTQSNCATNSFGYNVCEEYGTFAGPNLPDGNYWLTLRNANVPSGDPVYWDENNGEGCTSPGCPSMAKQSTTGSIPSEAFTLSTPQVGESTTSTGTLPEPSSIFLFGSGLIAAAGLLRRKLF